MNMDDFVKNNYKGFLLIHERDDDTCIGMIKKCYYNKLPYIARPNWSGMNAYKTWDDDSCKISTILMIKRIMELKK